MTHDKTAEPADDTIPRSPLTLDLVFAVVVLVVSIGRIAVAILRHEDAGAEVGIATALALLSGLELVRITFRDRSRRGR